MFLILQVASVVLTSVAMALALAHALELPGKLRLDKDTYLAVQKIYYPGFTVGGFGEVLGIVAVLALLLATPAGSAAFGWTLGGLAALVAMHAAYWVLTHPVNRFWLEGQEMRSLGAGFFGTGRDAPGHGRGNGQAVEDRWKRLRNRWELSHVVRACLALLSLVLLVTAVAL